jgi:hypothetical protein
VKIVAPEQFRHAGEITDSSANKDPRLPTFSEADVEIDLSHCLFIRPPALLWALTYALVAQKRSRVSVRLPVQAGVLQWMRSLGFPAILEHAGIKVDPPAVASSSDRQVVLPLTRFATPADAELVTADALDALSESQLGAPNVRPLVARMFSELALNAVQHSASVVAAYGYVQYYEWKEGARFVCGVSDGGVGIKESLRRNPQLRYISTDAHAIDRALELRVSGTRDPKRGIGLHWVREKVSEGGRRFAIHSAFGAIVVEGAARADAYYSRLFPGTAALLWVPT